MYTHKKRFDVFEHRSVFSGAEGSRTPVQTSSTKAFYMLILEFIVGL